MLSAVTLPERSQPAVPRAGQLAHQRFVRPGPLVLGTGLLKSPARAEDRDRTVSRRSKPSSRTALMGEQPNPWDLLQPQDATSRHRGAKPCRRYGLLGKISLLYVKHNSFVTVGTLMQQFYERKGTVCIPKVVRQEEKLAIKIGRAHV